MTAPPPHDPFERIERAIAAALLDRDGEEALRRDPAAFLAAQGLSADEVAFLSSQADRLLVYRTLVRNTLGSVLFQVLRRTRAHFRRDPLGPPAPAAFDEEVRSFLAEGGPEAHSLREVPREFVEWAAPRWTAAEPWLRELAQHELRVFEIAAIDVPPAASVDEVAIDRGVVFHPTARLERYTHAVHDLEEPVVPAAATPLRLHLALLLFRDRENVVQEIELSPFGALLVERLLEGSALGRAVTLAAQHAPDAPPGDLAIAEAATLLGELGDAGVVLGGRPRSD